MINSFGSIFGLIIGINTYKICFSMKIQCGRKKFVSFSFVSLFQICFYMSFEMRNKQTKIRKLNFLAKHVCV